MGWCIFHNYHSQVTYIKIKLPTTEDTVISKCSTCSFHSVTTFNGIHSTGSSRSKACLSVVGRGITWAWQFIILIWTFHLKCHVVCLSVILICYRMTHLWFCNKRICNKKGALFVPDPVYFHERPIFYITYQILWNIYFVPYVYTCVCVCVCVNVYIWAVAIRLVRMAHLTPPFMHLLEESRK